MEQVKGIEPSFTAWKAVALAIVLHLHLAAEARFELTLDESKSSVLPLYDSAIFMAYEDSTTAMGPILIYIPHLTT